MGIGSRIERDRVELSGGLDGNKITGGGGIELRAPRALPTKHLTRIGGWW